MIALKKSLLVLALGSVMTLASCGGNNSSSSSASSQSSSEPSSSQSSASSASSESSASSQSSASSASSQSSAPAAKYEREDDDDVFDRVMGQFETDYEGVTSIADDDERFVRYARAEATLLESGVFAPTTTQGGTYAMTRIAPRTIPYVFFGNDSDKVKTMVMTSGADSFIKATERAELIGLWEKARAGEGTYDPAAYLTNKGYTIGTEYKTTFSTPNATFDSLATSMQSDTEQMVNCVEGLIQYDNLGSIVGAMADRWESNADNTVYKFHIREGAKWFTSDRRAYGDVTADDFVAGFQHMLDAAAGLEYLVEGVVKGVSEYLSEGGSFDDVGCYVDDDNNLVFELEKSESFFVTRLAYSCFLPMKRDFFLSKGGAFGADFATAKLEEGYTYGTSITDVLYNSAFIPTTWDASASGGSMVITKNENYWDAENVSVTKATWVFDDGSNPMAIYAACRAGDYPGMSLIAGNGTLKQAQDDGLFDTYHYVSDTNATTYFGGLNLDRGTFVLENGACASPQSEEAKILTHTAMQSKAFRRAILHGWDRGTWNAVASGNDLKFNNLRNMYTQPEFVGLGKDVEWNGVTYEQGTSYGDLVQKFLDADEEPIKVADGQDGWFNENAAKSFMAAARAELGEAWPANKKVEIDLVYLSTNPTNNAQAAAFKELLEGVFPNDIQVNLIEATNTNDYHKCGYRAANGAAENQDIFYGSGWGPDYGDPSTYLDTFTAGGYMNKVIGLY